ncbi:MAG: hypothetical protein OEZ65_11750 [Gemmatimonadota bacterium]|nr:hypothetical protein [Gemmatimonadota bacterium]MDH5760255.1 hypothetical protein [Gemmatimonadota bacterium]
MSERSTDRLDQLLKGYERRKQEETRVQVERALKLDEDRRKGAELLRRFVLYPARDFVLRVTEAGHRVLHHELMDAFPPSIRIHLWPRGGPLDDGVPSRSTLEFVWGDPDRDRLCVKHWTSEGLDKLTIQSSARAEELSEAWCHDQLYTFVSETLERA